MLPDSGAALIELLPIGFGKFRQPPFYLIGGSTVILVVAENGLQVGAIAGLDPGVVPADGLGSISALVTPVKPHPSGNML